MGRERDRTDRERIEALEAESKKLRSAIEELQAKVRTLATRTGDPSHLL